MASRRTFVTGAGGFVGANLVRRLLADGHEVVATVRPGGDAWRLSDVAADIRVAEVDLGDGEALAAAIERERPEWIFHLAAHGAYSWQKDLARIFAADVLATSVLIAAARKAGADVLVHAGSSSEYGHKDHAPREDEVPEPEGPYAVAKLSATLLVANASRGDDLRGVTLRLYSAYGPWEEPRRL